MALLCWMVGLGVFLLIVIAILFFGFNCNVGEPTTVTVSSVPNISSALYEE